MSGVGDRILRDALSAARGPRKPSEREARPPGVRPASPRRPVFLNLELDAPGRQEVGERISELLPGESYRLTIRAGSHPEGEGGPAWYMRGDEMKLSVACPDCPELSLTAGLGELEEKALDLAEIRLTREQVEEGVEVDFHIEVPPDCPRRRGYLEVVCSNADAKYQQEACLRRRLDVQGLHVAWNPKDSEVWNVEITPQVPEHVAFLYVQERRPDWLTLLAWNRRCSLKGDVETQRPNLALASLIQEGQGVDEIVGRIRRFSQIPRLQEWLHGLLQCHGEELLLVIVDSTSAEVPWEMIGLRNSYLGAEAEVVRWAHLSEDAKDIRLSLENRLCSGLVVGYVDSGSSISTASEREELALLEGESLETPRQILERLSQDVADIGLLYVACHGAVATRHYQELYSEAYLNPQRTETQRRDPNLRIVDLDLEFLQRKATRVPAVFINACHSGRLGLPAVFLRKVADGYIGTLGAVNDAQASAIGTRILRDFRENAAGVRPSELLRRIRREASTALDPLRSDQQTWWRFLFTFMYVYYGNPLIRISLRSGSVSGEEKR